MNTPPAPKETNKKNSQNIHNKIKIKNNHEKYKEIRSNSSSDKGDTKSRKKADKKKGKIKFNTNSKFLTLFVSKKSHRKSSRES